MTFHCDCLAAVVRTMRERGMEAARDVACRSPSSLARVLMPPPAPERSLSSTFWYAYNTSQRQLLCYATRRPLQDLNVALPWLTPDLDMGFAVSEKEGNSRRAMATTFTAKTGTEDLVSLDGAKTFVYARAAILLVVGGVNVIDPSSPASKRELRLCWTRHCEHRFEPHPKDLGFLPELGRPGTVTFSGGEGRLIRDVDGQLVDGGAAMLCFRDIEDAHVTIAVLGHMLRFVGTQQGKLTSRCDELIAAAEGIATVIDAATKAEKQSWPKGVFCSLPPAQTIAQYTKLAEAKAAVHAVLDEAPPTDAQVIELRRDAVLLNIAQRVRDERYKRAKKAIETD